MFSTVAWDEGKEREPWEEVDAAKKISLKSCEEDEQGATAAAIAEEARE
jgi:hypothetical protein